MQQGASLEQTEICIYDTYVVLARVVLMMLILHNRGTNSVVMLSHYMQQGELASTSLLSLSFSI